MGVDFDMAGQKNAEVKKRISRKSLKHIIIAIIIISRIINVIITLSYCCSPPKDFLLLSGIVKTSSGISLFEVGNNNLIVDLILNRVVTRKGHG